jgi:hypothetical protein
MIDHAPKDSSEQEEMKMSSFFFFLQTKGLQYLLPARHINHASPPSQSNPPKRGKKESIDRLFARLFLCSLV